MLWLIAGYFYFYYRSLFVTQSLNEQILILFKISILNKNNNIYRNYIKWMNHSETTFFKFFRNSLYKKEHSIMFIYSSQFDDPSAYRTLHLVPHIVSVSYARARNFGSNSIFKSIPIYINTWHLKPSSGPSVCQSAYNSVYTTNRMI